MWVHSSSRRGLGAWLLAARSATQGNLRQNNTCNITNSLMYEPAALNIVHPISVMIMKEDFGIMPRQIKKKNRIYC